MQLALSSIYQTDFDTLVMFTQKSYCLLSVYWTVVRSAIISTTIGLRDTPVYLQLVPLRFASG